jgi:hypothetical protein
MPITSMRETVTLQLLGTPVLRLADGSAVKLRQKAYALAAVLYLEFSNRTRRSVLAERIWEASTAEQAMTNLRQTLLHTVWFRAFRCGRDRDRAQPGGGARPARTGPGSDC